MSVDLATVASVSRHYKHSVQLVGIVQGRYYHHNIESNLFSLGIIKELVNSNQYVM